MSNNETQKSLKPPNPRHLDEARKAGIKLIGRSATDPNGNIYEGEWKDDNRHGQGTFYYVTGASYSGEWNNGLIHGYGIYNYVNGDIYEGDFVLGRG